MKTKYTKTDDESVRLEIESVLKTRPSYGYKRITAMVNHERLKNGLKRLNKKRILRVMQLFGLILPKTTVRRTHEGTGKVMTIRSNLRWCSDCFEIRCYNREKVYVAFVMDTHDREVIHFLKKTDPILATDIQTLMMESVEKRFGKLKAPHPIEWLSDRGSIYRAIETKNIARDLGLKSCFTMAYSPESNGMAEALVHTMKRDYVYVNDCVDPKTVLEFLPSWFKDYNWVAPHSALGMLSPMQYLQKIS